MIMEVAERYFSDHYDFRARSSAVEDDQGFRQNVWKSFADLGWLGLPIDPEFGGSGETLSTIELLLEVFGRFLVTEPYVPTVVMCGMMLDAIGTTAQKQRWISPIVGGTSTMALAFAETGSGYDISRIETRVFRDDDQLSLTGRKAVVLGAPHTDAYVVSSGAIGDQHSDDAVTLFIIEASRPGVSTYGYQTIDGRSAAEVHFDNVRIHPQDILGADGQGLAVLEEACLSGSVAFLGEAVGVLEGAVQETVNYLKLRHQFDQPLSSLQALRHRTADMYIAKEEAKSLCRAAARSADLGISTNGRAAIAAAGAYVGRIGRQICEEAVQLHGAIAITDEYIVGHYLKRMVFIDRFFGDSDYQFDQYLRTSPPFAEKFS